MYNSHETTWKCWIYGTFYVLPMYPLLFLLPNRNSRLNPGILYFSKFRTHISLMDVVAPTGQQIRSWGFYKYLKYYILTRIKTRPVNWINYNSLLRYNLHSFAIELVTHLFILELIRCLSSERLICITKVAVQSTAVSPFFLKYIVAWLEISHILLIQCRIANQNLKIWIFGLYVENI